MRREKARTKLWSDCSRLTQKKCCVLMRPVSLFSSRALCSFLCVCSCVGVRTGIERKGREIHCREVRILDQARLNGRKSMRRFRSKLSGRVQKGEICCELVPSRAQRGLAAFVLPFIACNPA